ncbi:MAG: Coenzyme F420 hydrogenase/dehydrogenase, beta subunit C-terminal domain [Oscillospiraceae bacterium]|jgi:coenzyme F420-reducing hydrogenase beta subunit|nr:Coenzyme F420 hydrogenase/dehydrogenase, beta subunit C-terminal domain [Oscillospiraceae bacterium]
MPDKFNPAPKTVLAAWLKDGQARKGSSSGGFFRVLASFVLQRGGVVFGAAFDENFRLRHISAETERDCEGFYKSKYLQSDVGDTYKEAKGFLDAGRWVLYASTACQIAGLYAFLGGDRERLVTCDLVCSGAPAPRVFAKYLEYLEKKHGGKAVKVQFRPSLRFEFDNGKVYDTPMYDDPYGHGCGEALFLNALCGKCPYARPERVGDFTLGDFWGLPNPPPHASEGISLVLTNSEKAAGLTLPPLYEYMERPFDQAIPKNTCLIRSVTHSPRREEFFRILDTKPFGKAVAFMLPLYKRVGRKVRGILKGR